MQHWTFWVTGSTCPPLIILLWYTAYSHSHAAVAFALITLDHGAFRPFCSSWYSYGWYCLLHSCSSQMQILQVYVWNFGRNRKALLGCIIPLKCKLVYPISPLWSNLQPLLLTPFTYPHLPLQSTTTKSARFIPLLQMTSPPTPLTLLLQRSSMLYLHVNHPKVIAALLKPLNTILPYISSW
jgi:hypothetical protein